MDLHTVIKETFNAELLTQKPMNSFLDHLTLNNGMQLVLKHATHAQTEANMLNILGGHLPTATCYAVDEHSLLLEYIPDDCYFDEADAAQELAAMHAKKFDTFGFDYDTTIGPYVQSNRTHQRWIEFFTQERLLFMAQSCLDEKKISHQVMQQIESFAQKAENYLSEPPHPSLLHGDIWSGNVLCKEGKACYIDPAIYIGHYEMELAFITLFSTFRQRFFDSYKTVLPIEKDFWDLRKDIYNLYPLLVHVRSFGGGYLQQLQQILQRFAP